MPSLYEADETERLEELLEKAGSSPNSAFERAVLVLREHAIPIDSTMTRAEHVFLEARDLKLTPQEPDHLSTPAHPGQSTPIAAFLVRFESLAFTNLPNADNISETLQDLDALQKRRRALQATCSRARTYPNPTSFNTQDLYTEAALIQSIAAVLATSAKTYIATLQRWLHDIKTLEHEVSNAIRTSNKRATPREQEQDKLLTALDTLYTSATHILSQSQNHAVLKQHRADGFTGLVREVENLPGEGSVVVQKWFPKQGQRLLEYASETSTEVGSSIIEGLADTDPLTHCTNEIAGRVAEDIEEAMRKASEEREVDVLKPEG